MQVMVAAVLASPNRTLEELFVLQTMSDDRSVDQVYIKGVPSKNLQ